MKKKWKAVAAALAMCLSACNSSNSTEPSTIAPTVSKPDFGYLGFNLDISCEDEFNRLGFSDLYDTPIGGQWRYKSLTDELKQDIKKLWNTVPNANIDVPESLKSYNPLLIKAKHVRGNVEVNGYYILTHNETFGIMTKADNPTKYYWIRFIDTRKRTIEIMSNSETELWEKDLWEVKGKDYNYIIKDACVDEKTTLESYTPGISVLFYPMIKDGAIVVYSKELDDGGTLSKWECGGCYHIGNTLSYGSYAQITQIEFREKIKENSGDFQKLDYYTIYQSRDNDRKDSIREEVKEFLFPEGTPTSGREYKDKELFFENASNILNALGTYDFVVIK